MTSTKMYTIALVMALGCDQNWADPTEGDEAPAAPALAPPEVTEDDAVETEKHGSLHVASGTGTTAPGVIQYYDQCGSGYYSYACWWRHAEYGTRKVWTNYVDNTWYSDKIFYMWCAQVLSQKPSNFWIASGSAQLCISGVCADISNRVATSGGCRSGFVGHSELPLVISAGQTKHADIIVKLRQGDIPNPQPSVGMSVGPLHYWD